MVDEIRNRLHVICNERVSEVFDPMEFEVSGVYAGIHVITNEPYCVVDFRRRGQESYVECKDYCREAVEYFGECEENDVECFEELEKECVDECNDNVKKILTASVEFDPVTLRVKSATIPTSCENVWREELSLDEFEEFETELREKISEYGCEPEDVSWIHPHEIVPVETPELGYEEYPAMCYYHVANCSLRSVIRLMKEGVL